MITYRPLTIQKEIVNQFFVLLIKKNIDKLQWQLTQIQ